MTLTCLFFFLLINNKTHVYFIFALVTAAERALHSVATLDSDLPPHNNAGCRLFGAFHDKTAAAHAEGWGDLGQDFRKGLENTGQGLRSQSKSVCVAGVH